MGEVRSLKQNAILNMIKKGMSIVFPLITFTYSSHVLGPKNMGIYSFSQSVVEYFILIAALGISTYAVREGAYVRDNKEEIGSFANEVFSINVLMTVIAYVVLLFCLLISSKLQTYRTAILIFSLIIILNTAGADWVNTIFEDYMYITIRYIIVQIICLILLFVFVRKPSDVYRYVIIGTLSMGGGNLFNIGYIRRYVHLHFTFKMNLKKHIKPMLILFSNSIAVKIYLIADVTILGFLCADEIVGIYSVSSRIYTCVKELINAIIIVTVPRFSSYIAQKDIKDLKEKLADVFNTLVFLLIPCVLGLFFESKNILYILAGEKYYSGEGVIRILSIAMVFAVMSCFFSYSILIPFKQEKYFTIATVTAALTNVVTNFLLIPLWGMNAAALTTLLAEGLVFIITFYKSLKTIRFSIDFKSLISCLVGGGTIIASCLIANNIADHLLSFVVAVIVSAITYFLILIVFKNPIIINVFGKLKKVKS